MLTLGAVSGFLNHPFPTAMKKAAFEDIITQYFAYDPFLNNPNRKGRDHLMEDSAQAGNSKFIRPFVQPVEPIRHHPAASNRPTTVADKPPGNNKVLPREPSEPAKFVRPESESSDNGRLPETHPSQDSIRQQVAEAQQLKDEFVPVAPGPAGQRFQPERQTPNAPVFSAFSETDEFESNRVLRPSAEPLVQPEEELNSFRQQLLSLTASNPEPIHKVFRAPESEKSVRPPQPESSWQPSNIRPQAGPDAEQPNIFRHHVESKADPQQQQPSNKANEPEPIQFRPAAPQSIEQPPPAPLPNPFRQFSESHPDRADKKQPVISISSNPDGRTTYQYLHFPGRPSVEPGRPYFEDFHHHDPALFAIPSVPHVSSHLVIGASNNNNKRDLPNDEDDELFGQRSASTPPTKRFADPFNTVITEPPADFLKELFPTSPVTLEDFRGIISL